MINFSGNYFDLFGLPPAFRFDVGALDRAYRQLQSEVHPDRFAGGSDAEKRVALQSSARVNEAYRALKDPVLRAQYLLSLRGVEAVGESDTRLPFEFLERQLERREQASDAQAARDARTLSALRDDARSEAHELEDLLAQLLAGGDGDSTVRTRVRELTFLAKLADDIDAMLAGIED